MRFRKTPNSGYDMTSSHGGADIVSAAMAALAVTQLALDIAATRSGTVSVAVCPACRRRARVAWWGAMPLAALALAAVIVGSMQFGGGSPHALALGLAGTIGGAALLVAAIAWAVPGSHLLTLQEIANGELWFKPRGSAFVESLPEWPTDDGQHIAGTTGDPSPVGAPLLRSPSALPR